MVPWYRGTTVLAGTYGTKYKYHGTSKYRGTFLLKVLCYALHLGRLSPAESCAVVASRYQTGAS